MKKDDKIRTDHDDNNMRRSNLTDKLSMVLMNAMFLILLQHVVVLATTGGGGGGGHHVPPHRSLARDKAALLRFKSTVTDDPFSTLSNWNISNDVCEFNCVSCDRHRHRVSQLILNESHLSGPLSPFLSNLTGLRILWIVNSHLSGTIPDDLSRLRNLLSLRLEGNNFRGQVPVSIFRNLPKIESILLLENNLTGTLSPEFFTNCSSELRIVDFAGNSYSGQIPVEIGNCVNLWSLNLYNNQFTGALPLSLTNTSLHSLDVEYNLLNGELPSEVVGNLPELLYLHLSYNNMESHSRNSDLGPFFSALGNCTHLEELELAGMRLGGRLPESIGRLGVNLTSMLLQENCVSGTIPSSLSNLSALVTLNFTSNRLGGAIPGEIHALPYLEQLFLSHNEFTGPIPEAFGKFRHLGLLDLSHNEFSGEIPGSLGNLSVLIYLFLNNNRLSGEIPASLGRCGELHKLDLSHNRLSGKIPPGVFSGMSEIRIFLNLSHNNLEGPFPDELSKLKDVLEIDLSSNRLTGSITSLISSCIAVQLLNFSHNSLDSLVPDSIGDLKNLEVLDLSWNNLSGPIPASLNKSQTLRHLNLSCNDFNGTVPSGVFASITSFLNNTRLCGNNVPGLRSCRGRKKPFFFRSRVFLGLFSLVIFVSAFFSVICCAIGLRRVKAMISSRRLEAARRRKRTIAPELTLNFPRITYRELSDATDGFDEQRLVGSGSYGRVYKGVLSDGTAVAVKVLHVQSGNSTKSFTRECQVLKRIRHRNLIRIITACSLPDFKALVLPYMANGSLDSRLYPHSGTGLGSGSSDLNLLQRVNICSDVAEGMAYLHHHSPVRVIHCDLKPSNVLLNDDMTALVSDFGIARLVMTASGGTAAFENMGNSTANMLAGSIGYIAPEYGCGSTTSTKGDVYSFGVLVLEMVTRKRPTDDMFVGGLSLHKWVKSHYHYQGRVEKVVDSSLLRASTDQLPEVKKMWEIAIGELVELGLLCTQESPSTRPTMLDAADDLDRLKRYLFGDTTTTTTFASSLGISSSTHGDD